ncbi:MAG: peptidoglycan-binding protein [Lachnospiraceae bacterium]|nr:peptidoglycan-binding protein [Lachnospiraceae bacterium]
MNSSKVHNTEKDITKAQKWLHNLGSKVKVNGKMTIGMATAIYAFQNRYKLEPTGELDENTWKALKKENSWWKNLARKHCGHGGVKHG